MDFFTSHISKTASDSVVDVLNSGMVSEGNLVREFENSLCQKFNFPSAIAVNSGTSALHLSLLILGVGPGDEVILPPQTFISSGFAILMCGGIPVFSDINPLTGNIDPKKIKDKISPRTKGIMPVHWAGYPCDMSEISSIAKEHNLFVIEDAAHALGAKYKEEHIGAHSDAVTFSFQAIKHLTTGDGGLIVLRDPEKVKLARQKRWFGFDREKSTGFLGEREDQFEELGFKYHMNNLAAALGLANLQDFDENLKRRHQIAKHYDDSLKKVNGIQLLDTQTDRESSNWLYTILVSDRARFIQHMNNMGVPVSVVHQRIDRHPVLGGLSKNLNGQESFEEKQISLPLHPHLTDEDLDKVLSSVQKGWM